MEAVGNAAQVEGVRLEAWKMYLRLWKDGMTWWEKRFKLREERLSSWKTDLMPAEAQLKWWKIRMTLREMGLDMP